jgi:SAM domain (Sterile alpha motif)
MRRNPYWDAIMDVVVWLRSLGLDKYEAIFRENDTDETVLPSLTQENLKEPGVASFGHRAKLPDAIAALRNDGGTQAPTIAPARPASEIDRGVGKSLTYRAPGT